jgi:hypothetical protein
MREANMTIVLGDLEFENKKAVKEAGLDSEKEC